MSPTSPAARLRVVRTGDATGRQPRATCVSTGADVVSDLTRLAAGEPVVAPAVDLIAFANTGWQGLDPHRDPDGYTFAEVLLDWYHGHVGAERRTGGERAEGIASDLRRYVLPFALELDATDLAGGVGRLRLQHAKRLALILSGAAPLPAATVAGDLLRRPGVSCTWLTIDDAGAVCDGGLDAVRGAAATGDLPTVTAGGVVVVRPIWLRDAGLLHEREQPHGLAISTQTNILKAARTAIEHARDLGADVRGNFNRAKPIDPLPHQRLRPETKRHRFVTLTEIVAVARHLAPVYQVALWLMRMCGLRIGEAYGLRVSSVIERNDRMWLHVKEQGGKRSYGRDTTDGRLRQRNRKPTTKTRAERTIPVPDQLAALIREAIRVFHTDHTTEAVNGNARLIPGIGSDDDGGIAALYSALRDAFAALRRENNDVPEFDPHDLRYSVVTALGNAGVDRRLRKWYLGHSEPNEEVHDRYDLGPQGEELIPVADVLMRLAAGEIEPDLRVPTTKTEQWGTGTARAAAADTLRAELRATGWLTLLPRRRIPGVPVTPDATDDHVLDVDHIAVLARVGVATARRWMRNGELPAHQRTWGTRHVWSAYRSDVDTFLDHRTANVHRLAKQIGYSYPQTWALLVHLGVLTDDRQKGAAIRLTQADVDAVLAEVERRREIAARGMLLSDAAQRLQLPVVSVETLLRQGQLDAAPAPDRTRHRYVTVDSVERYGRDHPPGATVREGDLVVPVAVARKALGVTRPTMTHLITARQLTAATVRRRECVTLSSLERQLRARGQGASLDGVRAAATPM